MIRPSAAFFLLLMLGMAFCMGCGRKAPPRWVEPSEPMPPQGLSAVARPNSITLAWVPSPQSDNVKIKDYAVYRAPDGGKFEEIGSASGASFIDNTVTPGVKYTYRIIARQEADGPESKPLELRAWATVGLNPPAKPQVRIEPAGIVLEWAVDEISSGYRVYKNYTGQPPLASDLIITGQYMDKAEPSNTVRYHVRAVLEGDGMVSEGPASEAVEVGPEMFVPSAPKGVNAVNSEQKMLVFWDVNPEAWVTGYRVYRAIGEGGQFEAIGDSSTLALPDSNPPVGKLRYRVSALAGSIEGPPSNEALVTVKPR